jgi:hypothetical protein
MEPMAKEERDIKGKLKVLHLSSFRTFVADLYAKSLPNGSLGELPPANGRRPKGGTIFCAGGSALIEAPQIYSGVHNRELMAGCPERFRIFQARNKLPICRQN